MSSNPSAPQNGSAPDGGRVGLAAEPLPPLAAMALPEAVTGGPSQKLRRAFLWSLPFVVVLALLGSYLLALAGAAWFGLRSYEAGNYEQAAARLAPQVTAARYGPVAWVPLYNHGTALLAAGSLDEALELLGDAYEKVPKAKADEEGNLQSYTYECQVRVNLAVALESLGDREKAAGNAQQAAANYQKGLEWVQPCEMPPSDGEDDEQQSGGGGGQGDDQQDGGGQGDDQPADGQSTSERLDEKLNEGQPDEPGEQPAGEPQEQPGESPAGGEQEARGESPYDGETESERERREQLSERNRENQERLREEEESSARRSGVPGW